MRRLAAAVLVVLAACSGSAPAATPRPCRADRMQSPVRRATGDSPEALEVVVTVVER